MKRMGSFLDQEYIARRVRAANYLVVAQLFLRDNFLLKRELTAEDIKPRLLGHWGTCPGINIVYAVLHEYFAKDKDFHFVLGPGHGFPALQANLFIDKELYKVDAKATPTEEGIAYLCKNFSWPGGFPSHSSPMTPSVILEGGELGYALATAYGYCLGHRDRTVAVMIGDGELETATALASLNLNKIIAGPENGKVIPILHLNGYKISAPTVYGRKSPHELAEMLRGFGFLPIRVNDAKSFAGALEKTDEAFKKGYHPFIVFENEKGATGPEEVGGKKVAGNFLSHQIPLPNAKTDEEERRMLEEWLKGYKFNELFDEKKGFTI